LNAIDLEFRGKNVLLVDDSIVRGHHLGANHRHGREAGAKKVFLLPRRPRYAIRMCTHRHARRFRVGAAGHTEEEVRDIIGADWLIYQDLEDLEHAVRHDNASIKDFDTSCFSVNTSRGHHAGVSRAPAGRAVRRR